METDKLSRVKSIELAVAGMLGEMTIEIQLISAGRAILTPDFRANGNFRLLHNMILFREV